MEFIGFVVRLMSQDLLIATQVLDGKKSPAKNV
jgi:hypothetical protein